MGRPDRSRDIDAALAASGGCTAHQIAEAYGYPNPRQARSGIRRGLADLMAIESELLRRRVTQEADLAWERFEALSDAGPGTLQFGHLLAAADEAARAMDRQAQVVGLNG